MLFHQVLNTSVIVFHYGDHLLYKKFVFIPCPHGLFFLYYLFTSRSRSESASFWWRFIEWRAERAFYFEFLNLWGSPKAYWGSKGFILVVTFYRLLWIFQGTLFDQCMGTLLLFSRFAALSAQNAALVLSTGKGVTYSRICDWMIRLGSLNFSEYWRLSLMDFYIGFRVKLLFRRHFGFVWNILKSPDLVSADIWRISFIYFVCLDM